MSPNILVKRSFLTSTTVSSSSSRNAFPRCCLRRCLRAESDGGRGALLGHTGAPSLCLAFLPPWGRPFLGIGEPQAAFPSLPDHKSHASCRRRRRAASCCAWPRVGRRPSTPLSCRALLRTWRRARLSTRSTRCAPTPVGRVCRGGESWDWSSRLAAHGPRAQASARARTRTRARCKVPLDLPCGGSHPGATRGAC